MTHLDLFSGIGGFALAAETVWPEIEHTFCEIDPFCRVVIKKHWPNAHIYGDIRTLTNTRSEESCGIPGGERETIPTLGTCDLLTGGFPCQPFSHAGKRKGTDDDRHLWPEMRRVIQEFSPRYVVAENVRGLLSIEGGMVFETVCTDLEALGYEVQPVILPACAVNAPHRRDRVWIVARNTKYDGCNGSQDQKSSATRSDGNTAWTKEIRKSARPALPRNQNESDSGWEEPWPQVAARLCWASHGFSSWLDGLVNDGIRLSNYEACKKDGGKNMHLLWQAIQSKEIQRSFGRFFTLGEEEVLLPFMRKFKEGFKQGGLHGTSKETPQGTLRNLRWHREVGRSPQRRKHQEQLARKFTNIVPSMPYETALEVAEAWDCIRFAYTAIFPEPIVLEGKKYNSAHLRNAALKAYGNAIVPQVAIQIFQAIKQTEQIHLKEQGIV